MSNKATVEKYIEDVVAERIPVSDNVMLAVRRHIDDMKTAQSRGIYFDEDAANIVIDFAALLCHTKGEFAGQPFILRPWQMFIVWVVFGWLRVSDNMRRFRTVYLEIPRKNGKTTFGAFIGLYMFIADGEQGGETYAVATKRDQAKLVYDQADTMVKNSRYFNQRIKNVINNMSIGETQSKFEPLGADADSTDGLNISCAVIDELHAHKTPALYDVIDTATGARLQPLIFSITTAGFNQQGICYEQREYCQNILRGIIDDDTYFSYIAGIDANDDWQDEANWFKANPNLGVSCYLDDLQRKAKKAAESPRSLNNFLCKHLNRWTQQETRWLSLESWDNCDQVINFDYLKGRKCWAGLDLSSTMDLSALVLAFPDDADGYILLPFFWIPKDGAQARERRDKVSYTAWENQGLIETTEGNSIDYRFIRDKINKLADIYSIQEIAFDPFNATHIATQLGEEDGHKMIQFRQGMLSMNEPCKEFERLIISENINHGQNQVMRWQASNIAVKTDPSGNIRPIKPASDQAAKIDGIVSAIMAVGRAMFNANTKEVDYSQGVYTL